MTPTPSRPPGEASGRSLGLLRQVALLLWKDVLVEVRAGELLYATLLFAAIVVLLFSFAFLGGSPPTVEVMAGVLWVSLSLSGMLGISRSFEREREADTLRALLLSPAGRPALYLGKLLAISLLMTAVCFIVVPGLCLLFGMKLGGHLGLLAALLFCGILGFSAVAALFGAALGRARARELLLPLLVYPLIVPALLAGTRGTYGVLYGTTESLVDAQRWLHFLLVFDAVALTCGLWLFEPMTATE